MSLQEVMPTSAEVEGPKKQSEVDRNLMDERTHCWLPFSGFNMMRSGEMKL